MQFFKESLKHEDQIQQQIRDCREAFNSVEDTRNKAVRHAVGALLLLVTAEMADKKFSDRLKAINAERKTEVEKISIKFEARKKKAICPDVMRKPSLVPPIEVYEKLFKAACDLFERCGLMFKPRVEEEA